MTALDASADGGTELPTRPVRAVLTALIGTIAAALPPFLFGGLAANVRRDLGFGVEGIGLAVAGYFLVSAVASITNGGVGDRWGARRAILAGAVVSGITLVSMGAAQNEWQLGVALAFGGFGNALIQPAANLLLTQHVPEPRRGLAFGIKQSAIPASALLGGLAVASAGESLGWRGAFFAGVILAVATAFLTPPERTGSSSPAPQARTRSRITLGLALLAAAAGASTAAANSMSSYLVEFSIDTGMSNRAAGFVLMAGSAAGLISRIVIAWQSDHRPGEHIRVVAMLMGGATIGYLILATFVSPTLVVLGAMIAFTLGWGWNALLIYSVVRLYPEAPAAATGVSMGGGFAGSVFGPAVFGYLVGSFGFPSAWIGAAVCSAAAAMFVAAGRRRISTERGGAPGPGVAATTPTPVTHGGRE